MTGSPIREGICQGAILAAGDGNRLRTDGWPMHKPLVPVAGVPLIGHVLGNFVAAGIRRIAIIFNSREEDCARWARSTFPDLDLRVMLKSTWSSLESFREVSALLEAGPALFSTVDAWCARSDFLAFAREASGLASETVLAVTQLVEDERPLWVRLDERGRVGEIGGASGDAVTAGIYAFPERVRKLTAPPELPRLRDFLAWLVEDGEPVRAVSIEKVVDVDRGIDVELAERLASASIDSSPDHPIVHPITRSPDHPIPTSAWGIYRELAHSPGRETDDAEILRAAARQLEERGFPVALKSAEELSSGSEEPPPFLFVMCERLEVLDTLARWEKEGAVLVNSPASIRNTYRDRMIALFERDRLPLPRTRLVSTDSGDEVALFTGGLELPCWIKRGDVHNTQKGDVVFARTAAAAEEALSAMGRRGIARAVLQRHVEGDLIKFYGIGGRKRGAAASEAPGWFEWFYHRDQRLRRHPFDATALAEIVQRGAAALGLEIYGGDAIVTPAGEIFLIDLNAWPSFALYRDTAAKRIASYLAARFRREVRIAVSE